jgi:dipeptidase D
MKAIQATGWEPKRRIELIISYTEESDWQPFVEFLERNPPPPLNVALDAEYPVVIAEKGWCSVQVGLPLSGESGSSDGPSLASFKGGFFLSQVPEDAEARIVRPTPELEEALRRAADADEDVRFEFRSDDGALAVRAKGRSAHSSTPEEGRNAITHLARLLGAWKWPPSAPARMVRFTNDLVGTGFHAKLFGDVAYEHEFMGPLTLSFGTLDVEGGRLVGAINLRRPAGRTRAEVEASVHEAVDVWAMARRVKGLTVDVYAGEPHVTEGAPHVPVLLDTYRHFTGDLDAEPISIGGGTHARMVPQGVNFGPAMPGEPYTGHSEHEYITSEQFLLNLEMYTSLLVDLSVEK